MIDFGWKGKRYLVPTELEKLVFEMSLEIRKLEENLKTAQKTHQIKDGPLEVIKIDGAFHLVHSDVVSLIEALSSKQGINNISEEDRKTLALRMFGREI